MVLRVTTSRVHNTLEFLDRGGRKPWVLAERWGRGGIMGIAKEVASLCTSLFSLFSTFLTPWLRARCDDDFAPPPPRATFAPSSHRDAIDACGHPTRRWHPRGHPPGAAPSPPLSSSTPPERALFPIRPFRDAPGDPWESAGSLGARPNSLTV